MNKQKIIPLTLFLMLIQTFLSLNCDVLQKGPSDEQIKSLLEELIKQSVPTWWIPNREYFVRNEFGTVSFQVTKAYDGRFEEIRVIQRGKKQKPFIDREPHWPIKIYLRGTCTARYTCLLTLGKVETVNFETEAEYNFYQDPYGKWIAEMNEMFGRE